MSDWGSLITAVSTENKGSDSDSRPSSDRARDAREDGRDFLSQLGIGAGASARTARAHWRRWANVLYRNMFRS